MTDPDTALSAPSTHPPEWHVLDAGLSAWFATPSPTVAAAFVAEVSELSGSDGLDVDVRAAGVRVRIPVADPVEAADASLAGAISATAQTFGLAADPSVLQTLQLVVDATDLPAVSAFWQTVLDYEPLSTDGLRDPLRRDPSVSFGRLDPPRPLRNRFHIDVVRRPEAVDTVRTVVGQAAFGPFGVALADADGNEIDVVPGDELPGGPDTADWRVVFGAMTFYPTTSLRQAARLVTAVTTLAADAGRPIVLDLRPAGVTIDSGKDLWEEDGFVELAGRIQAAAHEQSLSADPTRLRFVQLGLDAADLPVVQAFWAALLGYEQDPRNGVTDIYDPRRLSPVVMFQSMDAQDTDRLRQRNRTHVVLVVPRDQVSARVDVALAAGGQVRSESPGRTTIADPEGNEVDIVAGA